MGFNPFPFNKIQYMQIYSKHNILAKIKDSKSYILVNPLYNQADIIDEALAMRIKNNELNIPELVDKNYIILEEDEKKIYRKAYLDFIDQRESDEVQLFFVPSYACNFSCTYCYQSDYDYTKNPLNKEIIDAFFSYILKEFVGKQYYITLFGGEPLLSGEKHRTQIEYFLSKTKEYNIPIAIVTNGYTLTEHIATLKAQNIKEIQVTLDGPAPIHNKRRKLNNGDDSFSKISKGIDACLSNNIEVNLRVVVDKENINSLPELAQYAKDMQWTKNPLFKTQLGRNYELHYCQEKPDALFTRINMYEELYELIKQYPILLEFHKPAFSISKYLFENGELPGPLFDSCPGCKTEWAFDYSGQIYSCTATVGKPGEELGKFYPNVIRYDDKISEWQNRDVLSINKCKECNLQLTCGGGCASVAKNQSNSICSPDCRPTNDLISIGIANYFTNKL